MKDLVTFLNEDFIPDWANRSQGFLTCYDRHRKTEEIDKTIEISNELSGKLPFHGRMFDLSTVTEIYLCLYTNKSDETALIIGLEGEYSIPYWVEYFFKYIIDGDISLDNTILQEIYDWVVENKEKGNWSSCERRDWKKVEEIKSHLSGNSSQNDQSLSLNDIKKFIDKWMEEELTLFNFDGKARALRMGAETYADRYSDEHEGYLYQVMTAMAKKFDVSKNTVYKYKEDIDDYIIKLAKDWLRSN